MLDLESRTAILLLKYKGHGIGTIADTLKISRGSVRKVIEEGVAEVPVLERPSSADPHRDRIIELNTACKGNLVRVQEELVADGIEIPYSTLTGFCRRYKIGVRPKERTGHYHFLAAEEMQHDTSPHRVTVGGKKILVQCASVVLCFSRMLYAQAYPTFNRFICKAFLTEAMATFFKGAAKQCMVDNTNVVIARGTGKNAVTAPEMKAFGDRFGFKFVAHEILDANRSARVEGPFNYIENNFYPGRTFADLADLNRQLKVWCEEKSHRFIKTIQARPIELYQIERPHLQPLPIYIPEVYVLHSRMVNLEGNVHLHTNRYSVPDELLCQRVQVSETLEKVQVYHGHKLVAEHDKRPDGARVRVTNKAHRTPRHSPKKISAPVLPEEKTLRAAAPELDQLVTAIRKKGRGKPLWSIKKLYRFYLDYPTEALCKAVRRALEYGLTDLERIERMCLRNVAGDYFRLDIHDKDKQEKDDNE